MIGDIVGRPGRKAIAENISGIKMENKVDIVIANGENAAGGNGITLKIANELFGYGIDVLTMGNHVWDKKEIFDFINKENRIVRPANYPPGTPGKGYNLYKYNGLEFGVVSLSGRVYLADLDCPFRAADAIVKELSQHTNLIFVDFHAEVTSEKKAMGYYLDGRVSAVCGTHTHVQTADEDILPEGTAYITDLGMTGPKDSILGVEKEIIINKFITQLPTKFEIAQGPYQLNGVIIDVDDETGKATSIVSVQNYEY
jgi:2',3'-cyclic-nucleotide 2'-phosphodiesterase